jgi:S1-C subfamily serine protease
VAALMTEGRFRRAYLGIGGGARPLPPRLARQLGRRECVEVVQVVDEAPAGQAGLRPGDLIVALAGSPVESVDDLQRLMVTELIGRAVEVTVARNDEVVELELVPAELEA